MPPAPSRNDPCPCGSGRKYKNCCMAKDREAGAGPAGVPLDAGLRVVAAEQPWEVGILPLPVLMGDHPGARVSLALVTAGGFALHQDVLTDPLGRAEDVADALDRVIEAAVRRLGAEPPLVWTRHDDVAHALALRLARRGVPVDATSLMSGFDEAAASIGQAMFDLPDAPRLGSSPTWKGWGISPPQCRAFFAAAAHFRRSEPWTVLGDERIGVWTRHGHWAAAVMGSGGADFGLSVYTDPEDYGRLYESGLDALEAIGSMRGSAVTLSFEPRGELPREMQREVAAAGWEVADPAAYPLVYTKNTPAGGLDPALLDALTALLLAIPDFVEDCADEIEGSLAGHRFRWEHEPTGVALVYQVPGGYEWPVPEHLKVGGPEGPGATPGVILPEPENFRENRPDAGAVEAFEEYLAETVSRPTARNHARNAEALVSFLNWRLGVPLSAMHEHDLRTFLYDDFPRGRPGFSRIEALSGSLRKFFAFVAERLGVTFPWAEPLLADKDTLHRRVHEAPEGGWWRDEVLEFRGDLWADLDARVMLVPDNWGGTLEVRATTGLEEARLRLRAQRQWLTWRDDLIGRGTDQPHALLPALMERLRAWLDGPHDGDAQGRSRLDVIRAERAASPGPDQRTSATALGLRS